MKNKTMKTNKLLFILVLLSINFSIDLEAKGIDTIPSNIYSGLKFRNICPAFISGRISDLAVNPENKSEYYVATAAGGAWKTTNNGTTYEPVFDDYGSYSLGCITMDPKNSNIIWIGTGENTSQRSVSYGDGVYKSLDGGKNWTNMGLKESYQIGKILVHPENSNIVFVAAEGSVWSKGGDRGLYKSTDGGTTWERILFVSDYTGVTDVLIDPVDNNIMYASAEQRMRRNQTRIGGGPESSFWKSTDGGTTWRKIEKGLPSVDKGGMAITISPVDNDVLYAMVEATLGESGFYRSDDKGETWNKMSNYATSGQYYCEIIPSPFDVNTVYSTETVSKYTTDGGKTWSDIGNNKRHVDDHVFWIDNEDSKHFMIGTDGGLYETFDGGSNYIHKLLPVTQFYRVKADNTEPFYWIYGGTQDNSSLGSPTNTLYSDGISRGEWEITLGGDGFWQDVDPENTDIVYSEYQYGNIHRIDKKSGEKLDIKPREAEGDSLYKWNWNAPFILSSHDSKTLYIAADYLFKSTDRGQSWKKISGDLTSGVDRNNWPVMDRFWGVDAVEKDVSTSLYGTAVSLAESPINSNILFVGTDDGVLSITKDGGKTWNKIQKFSNVPEYTYISDIEPSAFDENTVYVTFDNHKNFDFTPYVLVSDDLGKSWKSIASDLPKNSPVHTIKQDFVNSDLLFLGTEFGLYFTKDNGKQWIQLKSGLPTIAVMDIDINKKENDLVLATFGRGFYVLDNYSSLRNIDDKMVEKDFVLFSPETATLYVPKSRGGYGFGSMEYFDKNEPFGITFDYYVKEVPKTLKEIRHDKEAELIKTKSKIPIPDLDELRKENDEIDPYLSFVIKDSEKKEIRKLNTKFSKGISRITWNLKKSEEYPQNKKFNDFNPIKTGGDDFYVQPGDFYVDVIKYVRGNFDTLITDQKFVVKKLNLSTLNNENLTELADNQDKLDEVFKESNYFINEFNEVKSQFVSFQQLANNTPGVSGAVSEKLESIGKKLSDMEWEIYGQIPKASYEERIPQPVPLHDRLDYVNYSHNSTFQPFTETEKDALRIIEKQVKELNSRLDVLKNNDLEFVKKNLK
ncbi:MAG: glycosyl hydrolase [Saprospiraceae bacterium]